MQVNADFSQLAIKQPTDADWVASPMPGVDRCMLDRLGHDGARATSIVSYVPGSQFSPHVHHGGEEFLVLEGTFQDEHGDYPVGTYVRNPPTSRHTPGAADGCVIFVKLGQFDLSDRSYARIDTAKIGRVADPQRPGVMVSPLFADHREEVQFEDCQQGSEFIMQAAGGVELLVVRGRLTLQSSDDKQPLPTEELFVNGWLRIPPGEAVMVKVTEAASLWVKRQHLTTEVLQDSAYFHLENARRNNT